MYKVQILLSTYNGEKYLPDFLESIYNQKGVITKIIARDDGSTDETIKILNYYKKYMDIDIIEGNNLGVAKSFRKLIDLADDNFSFHFFADQDDVWLENKIITAISKIENTNKPALYYSSAILVDKNLNKIGITKLREPKNIRIALIENDALGCTMGFNSKFLGLIKEFKNIKTTALHDVTAYRLANITNTFIVADNNPHILYRQHDDNVVGGENGLKSYIKRRKSKKRTQNFDSIFATELLNLYQQELSKKTKKILIKLSKYKTNILYRIILLVNPMYRRSDLLRTIYFKYLVVVGKF